MKSIYTYVLCIVMFLFMSAPLQTSAFWFFTPKRTLTSGLIGWWTFDGKEMTPNIRDASGNGNHGNLVGQTSTTTTTGVVGQALKFDGINDTVNAGNIAGADGIGQISMGGWVKINSGATGNQSIITKDNYGVQDQYQLFANTTFGRWTIVLFNQAVQAGVVESGNSTVKYDTWQHVLTTYDGSFVRLYVDGVEVGTAAALTGNVRDLDAPVCLGNTADSGTTCSYSSTFYLNGALDDVRLYNRALSASEVKQLYSQGAGSKQNITPSKSLTSGLIGWWTFDGKDVVNGRINDISGNGNHGAASGISTSTFYTAGRIGQALAFNGDNYVNVGDIAAADGGPTITVGGWVKFTSSSGGGNVFYKGQSGFEAWQLARNGFGRYYFFAVNSGFTAGISLSDSVYDDTSWHHVVGVYDGANVYVYVDGVLADSSANPLTGNILDRSEPICMGGIYGGGCTGNLNGKLDDARIYSRAFSATEVAQWYAQGSGSKQNVATQKSYLTSNLIGWWTFDGKNVVGGRVLDTSGGGNHGNMANISTSTFYTVGKIGQGFRFDGSDDYIDVGNNSTIELGGSTSFALSMWVRSNSSEPQLFLSNGEGGITCGSYAIGITIGMCDFADSSSKYVFIIRTSSGSGGVASETSVSNEWTHIVGTYDGSSIKIYVNGIEEGSVAQTGTLNVISTNVYVGADPFLGTTRWVLNGGIDDIRIYNKSLAANEVSQLYNQGK